MPALLTLLCLLTLATSADCACVLWDGPLQYLQSDNPRAEEWVLVGAYKTVEQCSQAAVSAGTDRADPIVCPRRNGLALAAEHVRLVGFEPAAPTAKVRLVPFPVQDETRRNARAQSQRSDLC